MTASPLLTTAFAGEIGVARADITPPPGINARNWGASRHDLAAGVHRPLTATALALAVAAGSPPLVLLAADLGWWKSREDEWFVRGAVLDACGLAPAQLLLSLSHTHAGPNLYREDHDKPGGDRIAPYLDWLRARLIEIARAALAARQPARLSWRYGRCDLAQNRDLPRPAESRHIVGWNPAAAADDTLLVGRVESIHTGQTLATVVNYACHPTTLAWENRLLSPDFPGAMREVVEHATTAPCLFLQGASGDLGTAAQHGSDPAVADRLGRRLGHAVLGVCEAWPDPLLVLDQVVESGAPLGIAHAHPPPESGAMRASLTPVVLGLKSLDSLATIEAALLHSQDRALRERLWRKRAVRRIVGDGSSAAMPLWVWRWGEAAIVAQPNEAYSPLQIELRRRFAPRPIVVLNVTNGYAGYLPPRDHYSRDQYSVWQTPFAAGGLEQLIAAADHGIRTIFAGDTATR
jgi:hypothetical protein